MHKKKILRGSFYRPANEIFGKIGRFAHENVTLQLIHDSKQIIPALSDGLEAGQLNIII